MKFKHIMNKPAALAVGFLFLLSCAQDKTKEGSPVNGDKAVEARQPNPFPFYKNVLVRPGLTFEVLSWGKGVDSVGGYLILMSDSTRNDFQSLSNERNGIITDAWNMDLDNDGNPEVYIELLSKQNVRDLNVYEYSRNGFQKISFPPLSSRAKQTYGGNDKFFIKNGDLFRSYPLVNSTDTATKPGSLKLLQYKLNGNSFSIDEIEN